MRLRLFFAALAFSGSAAAHMTATTTGAGVIYNADFEEFSAGTPVPVDTTGESPDQPSRKDTNLSAIVQDSSGVEGPSLSTRFARLGESCGEAPNLAFDRGIALGKAASPNAIAHVAIDVLFENIESYQILFRNGSGSGIPGEASQTLADIDFVPGPVVNIGNAHFSSLGSTTSIAYSAGVPIHIDAFFDLGNNKWYAFVNGGRIVNGAAILDTAVLPDGRVLPVPLGFVGIGFNFSSFCPEGPGVPTPGASFAGVMQFDNFVFQQVTAVPGVTPTPTPPPIANILTGVGRPFGAAIHEGYAYIADPSTHTVWKVNLNDALDKTPVAGIGWKTDVDPQDWQGFNGDGIDALQAQLDNPSGVAIDPDTATLYIADTGNHAVRKVALGFPNALISTAAGIPTSYAVGDVAPAACVEPIAGFDTTPCLARSLRLFGPRAVALDQDGNLYIADRMNQQVKRVDKETGFMFVVAGVAGETGGNDGPAVGPAFCSDDNCTPGARLNSPVGVAVDGQGVVYIADEGNNRIRTVDGDEMSTLQAFGFVRPTGVAVTSNGGTLYIADYGNHRIRRASQCHGEGCDVLETVAGTETAGMSGAAGGAATAAQLNSPIAVTLDGDLLYIADMLNGRLVAVDVAPTPAPIQ